MFTGIKKLGLFLMILSILMISSCGGKKPIENVIAENVLPEDILMVMAIDHTDKNQVENFNKLVDKFPDSGLWDEAIKAFNEEVGEDYNYETVIKPIINSNWRILVGMSFDENKVKTFEDFEKIDETDMELYIAFELEEADKFEEMFNKIIEEENKNEDIPEIVIEEDDELKYWSQEGADMSTYFVRHENLFFLTNSMAYRDAAIERLRTKESFVPLSSNSLGYFYLDMKNFFTLFGDFYTEMGMNSINDYMKIMGEVYMSFIAEEDGFRFITSMMVEDPTHPYFSAYADYDLTLVNKISAKGLFLYTEYPNLGLIIESMAESLSFEMGRVLEVDASEKEEKSMYDEFIVDFSATIGISKEELIDLMNSPFAFAISDVGELYPAMGLYLDVTDAKSGDLLVKLLDSYVDEAIVELDKLVMESGVVEEGILKKDLNIVNGGSLRRIYLDWDKIPQEFKDEMMVSAGFDVTKIDVELFYGITGDNVLVIALYPGFNDDYGKEVIAEDPEFKKAYEALDDIKGASLGYMKVKPLFKIVERWVALAEKAGEISEVDMKDYELVRSYVETIDYFITSGKIDDKTIYGNAFMGVN